MNLLRVIAHIAIAEARHATKQPHLLAMLLGLPIVFSTILAIFQTSDPGPLRIVVSKTNTPQTQAFKSELERFGLTVETETERTRSLISTGYRDAWVRFSTDFDERVETLQPLKIDIVTPSSSSRVFDALERIRAGLIALQAPFIAARAAPNTDAAARTRQLLETQVVTVKTQEVSVRSKRNVEISGSAQIAPGMTLMFALLFGAQTGLAFQRERTAGTLTRLFAAPVNRFSMILGKLLGNTLVLSSQLVIMVIFSNLALGVQWGNPAALIAPGLAFAFASASFGALCAAVTSTSAQLSALSVLSVNVLSALGGLWWPLEVTPEWMQRIARFLPTYWGLDAMQEVILRGAQASSLLPHTLILVGFSAIFVAVGSQAFKYE
jgi:ABC-2 type transport system permease protein